MINIHMGSNAFFQVDNRYPFAHMSGHGYYIAERISRGAQDVLRQYADVDESHIFVEADDMYASDQPYAKWCDCLDALNRKGRLPSTIILPELFTDQVNHCAGYIVKLPGLSRDFELLSRSRAWGDYRMLFELYAKGLMDANSVGLKPVGFFINLRSYSVFVDTMPSWEKSPWADMNYFLRVYGDLVDPTGTLRQVKSTTSIFAALSRQSDAAYQAVEGGRGEKPWKIRMMAVVTKPRRLIIGAGTTDRKNVEWTPGDAPVMLNDLEPSLPKKALLEVRQSVRGQITLFNVSEYSWISTRYSGMTIAPGGELTPRLNEIISIELPDRKRVGLRVRGFAGREASVPIAAAHKPTAPQIAAQPVTQPTTPDAALKPNTPQPATQPAPMTKPLSGIYDYDVLMLPARGSRIPAKELATGHRVLLERCGKLTAALRDAFAEQKKTPLVPVEGLCGLVNLHAYNSEDEFILAQEYPEEAGWHTAGSPALRSVPMPILLAAAEGMMRLLDGVLAQGWMPVRFVETHMLIRPETREARFLDGAWLVRRGGVPFECTLGYRSPEAYDPAHGVALPDVSFCAAVWLYRLLIGGYPMEGAQTRCALLEAERAVEAGERPAPAGEEELAQWLYGKDALFAFDPADRRNAVDGLGGTFDEQVRRWKAAPEALRDGWIQTFSTCLHGEITGRMTPAQWADMLRGEIEKEGHDA